MDQLDQEIYDIWSELHPYTAYQCGASQMVGRFFIPTEENIENIIRKIDGLKVATLDSVNLGLFDCFVTMLKLEEPYTFIYDAIWAYFAYIVKDGVNVKNLEDLTRNIIKSVSAYQSRLDKNNKSWSTELKIITHTNYLGLLGILESIEKEAAQLKTIFDELRCELKKYMKKFVVQKIKTGDFSEVFPILETSGGNIGRKEVYPNILKNMYGYLEQPDEIETRALNWLNNEKQKFFELIKKLAALYNVDPTAESVSNKLARQSKIKKEELISFIQKLREPLRKLMEANIVRVTPKYDTRLMETPKYLLNMISTGAMQPFDIHTEKPFNIFFVTTSASRSPPTNLPELVQLVVHEEFGHCVHFSNSAAKFDAKINLNDLIYTTLALPISDGISFYREWEALELLKKIISQPESELNNIEHEFLDTLKSVTNPEVFLLEFEYIIMRWRIIRFLRAIGDIRINMHKQSIAEFINWANDYTGLAKKTIFDQIFLFQARPGYAPCYSIVGERIRELQARAKGHGRKEIEFNTFASSLGFPVRAVFEQKLKEF